jgi:hypothetical protein
MHIPSNLIVGYAVGFLATMGVGTFMTLNQDESGDQFALVGYFIGCMATLVIAIFWPIALPLIGIAMARDYWERKRHPMTPPTTTWSKK